MGDAPLVSPKKYCNVTFLSVGDAGPDGLPITRLLRCSHCQETYYCGREQQRRHWKVHKFVCRSPRDEIGEEHTVNLSMTQVAEAIKIFFNPAWNGADTDMIMYEHVGRPLLFLLKRLQILCYEEPDIALSEQEVASAISLVKMLKTLVRASNQTIELLWAVPGMTTFLLNVELMSLAMRERKLAAALPSDEELLNSVANGLSVSRSSCFFAIAICVLFEASFVNYDSLDRSGSGSSTSQQFYSATSQQHYRNTAVATCAARKMMQLYADPYTRGSLPTDPTSDSRHVRFADALAILLHFRPDDPLDSAALVPGMTVHAVYQIVITESCWRGSIGMGGCQFFREFVLSASAKPKAWEAFSVEARASIAHKLFGLYSQVHNREEFNCLSGLFLIVFGYNNINDARDDKKWLRVVKLAATPEFGPYTETFSNWYKLVCGRAVEKLDDLVHESDVSLELVPSPVMAHITDYAVDPFGFDYQFINKILPHPGG